MRIILYHYKLAKIKIIFNVGSLMIEKQHSMSFVKIMAIYIMGFMTLH